jgi:hypothetical protein
MDLKSKFYTIFKSLNPYNYQELTEHKFSQVIKYYFFIIIFSLCIMFLIFIPYLFYVGTFVTNSVSHFDELNLTSEFSLKDSFNILSNPVIRLESDNKNMTNEMVLITPQAISYKHYLLFGPVREIPLQKGIDLATSTRARTLIGLGLIFIFPSLFFWSIWLSLVYFSVIILITYIFVLIITGLLRINLSLFRLFKSCIYASTIFIMLQLILMPFFRMFFLPLAVYWLLMLIILFLWRDHGKSERDPEHSGKSGSKKNIFGERSGNSFNKSSSKADIRDEYEVDENGNAKGSSRKHASRSDEDDGYVEL